MKKILFSLVALLISVSAMAQGPQRGQRREFNPEDMATRQADRIKTACGINNKQYKAIYDYFLRQAKDSQARYAKTQPGERRQMTDEQRQAFREEAQKRQQEQNDTIKSILNKKQYAKYEKMLEEQRNRGPQGGLRGQGGPRPQGGQRPQGNR